MSVLAMVVILGTMLPAAVTSESTSSCVLASMSALSLPSSVTQLDHAAFAMLTEPSIVVAASMAVVLAMPCFCCTRSIAVTMSLKLSMLRFEACPMLAAYSFASAIRRSISDLVPPYPSFRLSSMV